MKIELPKNYEAYELTDEHLGGDEGFFFKSLNNALATSTHDTPVPFTLAEVSSLGGDAPMRAAHLLNTVVEVWQQQLIERLTQILNEEIRAHIQRNMLPREQHMVLVDFDSFHSNLNVRALLTAYPLVLEDAKMSDVLQMSPENILRIKVAQAVSEMIYRELIRMQDAQISQLLLLQLVLVAQECVTLTLNELIEELWEELD